MKKKMFTLMCAFVIISLFVSCNTANEDGLRTKNEDELKPKNEDELKTKSDLIHPLIVYCSPGDNATDNSQIYIMNADGSHQTNISNNEYKDLKPIFLEDGKKILFASNEGADDGWFFAYVMNIDGSERKRLTSWDQPVQIRDMVDSLALYVEWDFSLCKKANRVAFQGTRYGDRHIFTINTDGTDARMLTMGGDWHMKPSYSPSGDTILFYKTSKSFNIHTNHQLYTINSDGTNLTRLTNNEYTDIDPAWSPDGTKIAYTSQREGKVNIYIMNADGTGEYMLTDQSLGGSSPAWSPDGTKIAYISSKETGMPQIYTINIDGSGNKNITNNDFYTYYPSWSPVTP